MPAGDGTGPWGYGPRSGRAAGYCAGFGRPGFLNRRAGPGLGLGFRGGRGPGPKGLCRRFLPGLGKGFWSRPATSAEFAATEQKQQRRTLQEQIEFMENALTELRQRLYELDDERKRPSRQKQT